MKNSSELMDSWKSSRTEFCFITEPGEILCCNLKESSLEKYTKKDFMAFDDLRRSSGNDIKIYKSTRTIVVQSIRPLKLVGRFGRFCGVYRDESAKSLSELVKGFVEVLEDVVQSKDMGGWSHELVQILIDNVNMYLDTIREPKIFKILPDMRYVSSIRIVVPKEKLFEVASLFYNNDFDLAIGGISKYKYRTVYFDITSHDEFYADVIFNKRLIKEDITNNIIEKIIKTISEKIKAEKVKSIVIKKIAFDYYYRKNPSLLAKLLWIFGKHNDAICEAQYSDTTLLSFLVYMFSLFILIHPLFAVFDEIIQNFGPFQALSEPFSGIIIRLIVLAMIFIGFLVIYEDKPFLDPAIREFEKDVIDRYLNDFKDEILEIVLNECRKLTKGGISSLAPQSLSKAKFKRIEELIEMVIDDIFDKRARYYLDGGV